MDSSLYQSQFIISVLAHEMHEVNALREMLGNGRSMQFSTFYDHVRSGRAGNLHDEAWDVANQLLDKIYGAP